MAAVTVSTTFDHVNGVAIISFALPGPPSFTYTHSTGRVTAPARSDPFNLTFEEAERLQGLLGEWIAKVINQFNPPAGVPESTLDLGFKKNPASYKASLKWGTMDSDLELDGSEIKFKPRPALNMSVPDFINWIWMYAIFRILLQANANPLIGPLPWVRGL